MPPDISSRRQRRSKHDTNRPKPGELHFAPALQAKRTHLVRIWTASCFPQRPAASRPHALALALPVPRIKIDLVRAAAEFGSGFVAPVRAGESFAGSRSLVTEPQRSRSFAWLFDTACRSRIVLSHSKQREGGASNRHEKQVSPLAIKSLSRTIMYTRGLRRARGKQL
jgi:hypothetical protein